ncbi:hypothetical protein A2W24_04815 [Microgenomates group bacterium RBG_16_45_19]|nr:MAG: hypothetical protein A2W24_04815 [Microgenomates group bacterium RBG_16_45_19]
MKTAVVDNLPDGGAKRVVFEQIKGLARVQPVVYFTNELESIFPFEQYTDVRRYPFERPGGSGWQRPLADGWQWGRVYRSYQRITQAIRRERFDWIMVHPCRLTQAPLLMTMLPQRTLYYAEEWFRLIYEPQFKPPTTLPWMKRSYERWRRAWLARADKSLVAQAGQIMVNSKYTQRHFSQVYGLTTEVNYPGVDTTVYKPRPGLKRDYFLFVGEPDVAHGYDLVKGLMAKFNGRVKFKIIALKAGRLGLTDQAIKTQYQGAIATLCLDKQEPFGLIPLESMACGTPVIAVKEGGYRETIRDGQTGWLRERRVAAIYPVMLKFLKQPGLVSQFGQAGRDWVEQEFTWKRHLDQLADALTRMGT